MRSNSVKQTLLNGKSAINGWLAIPSAFSAEVMAHQGWDSLTIDLQHGLIGYADAVSMLQAISTTSTVPMVRCSWLDEGSIMKLLDAGAYGVICPMINSADEARRFVSACRFPPYGRRSIGPIRASLYGGPDYQQHANGEVLTFAMIETREGLDALDDILDVPGLDGIYVGPSDLAASMGRDARLDPTDPLVVETMKDIARRVRAKGLIAGVHNLTPAYARTMLDAGFQLVTVYSDVRLLNAKAAEVLSEMRVSAEGVR
jgi:4-hydroxy-2-oxoheptanedioate aldolase